MSEHRSLQLVNEDASEACNAEIQQKTKFEKEGKGMPATITLFPSQLIGLKPGDQVAKVVTAENGRALTIRPYYQHHLLQELRVFAHNDVMADLRAEDWVRFTHTAYGPLVIERLAAPGQKPLPHATYQNGEVYVDPNDPAWRLYE